MRFLRETGEPEAAERILENGWRHAQKLYPRAEREKQRELHFRPVKLPPPGGENPSGEPD